MRAKLIPALDAKQGIVAVRIAHAMHQRWPAAEAGYLVHGWLEERGIEKPGLAARIVAVCGADAPSILAKNPYLLARALPWPIVDELGKAVLSRSSEQDAQRASERLLGACERAMADVVARGHTAVEAASLQAAVAKRLAIAPDNPLVTKAIEMAVHQRRVISDAKLYRSPGCAWMERKIASRLVPWARQNGVGPDELAGALSRVEPRLPRELHSEQVAAVARLMRTRFSVLTGGAGTGKTATLRAVADVWEDLGGTSQLVTLSGKAALRLSQATGRLAKTIHRLLTELEAERLNSQTGDAEKTTFTSRTLLIIDEASMVDLGQWMRLTEEVERAGASILAVGDIGQLPPIGPGAVFHDVVSQSDWTARLCTIHRQAQSNGIPQIAQLIREGCLPDIPSFVGAQEGVFLLECSADTAIAAVSDVVSQLGGFSPANHDLQIVAALNRTVAGINAHFHQRQVAGGSAEVRGEFGAWFCVGDPIVHLENDYQAGLFNGMLGHVMSVDPVRRSIVATFEGKEHGFSKDRLLKVGLAYSLTCHKLQGSQSQRIVVMLDSTPLLDPAWLYTAVTRAEVQAVLVGTRDSLEAVMRRQPAYAKRVTAFAHEIQQLRTACQ